jgi:threonine dehydratase
MAVTLQDIQAAAQAIAGQVIRTPTVRATRLSLRLGVDLHLKLENLQHTNAFKARGALAKLLTLDAARRAAGVIACSAGNHAQGLAYHAQRLSIPAVIVMPHGTPFNKVQRTREFGAEVVLHGADFDESVSETYRIAKARGLTFVHPFDDPAVVAGQGTLGLEIMEQVPGAQDVVVPIGGGGLIAGVATAVKGVRPGVRVIGAQAASYNAAALYCEGRASAPAGGPTLAEGIAVKAPSEANLAVIRALVDEIYTADEAQIERAIFDLLSAEKLVAEGAAGAGLAVIEENVDAFAGRTVVLVLCGGNVDSRLLSTLILRGMIREGRIARLRFEIDDTPGQLSGISGLIGQSGANVIEVIHQRMMQAVPLKRAELDIVIEARDRDHVGELVRALRAAGFAVSVMDEV